MAIRHIAEKRDNDPFVKMIRVSDICIDYDYQRQPAEAHVNKIARSFDPEIFGTLTVSQRADGRYYIIDGQHRMAAMIVMNREHEKVPCVVLTGLTVEQEAHIFGQLAKTRRPLTPLEVFKSDIRAGDETALEILEIVEMCGFRIDPNERATDRGNIPGVAALNHVYEKYRGAGNLIDTLSFIAGTWGTTHGPRHTIVRGVSRFLQLYVGHSHLYDADLDLGRLSLCLGRVDQEKLIRDAQDARSLNGTDVVEACIDQMVKHYNRGLREGNRIPERAVMVAMMRNERRGGKHGH